MDDWSAIAGNPAAPYLNQTLAPQASRATQYFTPPGNHPSEPNYLWLEAGTNFRIANDGPPSRNHQQTNQHLVSLLRTAGISWKAYEEGISGRSCPLQDPGRYATKHDPFVYFDDVTDGGCSDLAYCIDHIWHFAELASDLVSGKAARSRFITLYHLPGLMASARPTAGWNRQPALDHLERRSRGQRRPDPLAGAPAASQGARLRRPDPLHNWALRGIPSRSHLAEVCC